MILHIPNVLNDSQVASCCEVMHNATWVDGRVTAGYQSAGVKDNRQLPEDSPEARKLGDMIIAAEEYDGGELVIDDVYGAHAVKLPAGDMVLYPATSLHRVNPVTRGTRLASFFWAQSMVRDESQRTLLFDLDMAINQVSQALSALHPGVVALTNCYHNLLRCYAEV
jgi:PKHD-type hydroxylase